MKEITIDGETITRDDEKEVCVGYYTDSDEKVVGKFALPKGSYKVPDSVESIVYLSSMNDVRSVKIDPLHIKER